MKEESSHELYRKLQMDFERCKEQVMCKIILNLLLNLLKNILYNLMNA